MIPKGPKVAVHLNVAESIDSALLGTPMLVQVMSVAWVKPGEYRIYYLYIYIDIDIYIIYI